jgi:hypothetical protein
VRQKITQNGIVSGLKLEEYHQQCTDGPSVSSSGLRRIATQSLAHFWAYSSLNPDAEPQEESASMVLGKGSHHLFLGEDNFSLEYVARPETLDGEPWQGNRKVCRQWLKDQEAIGRTILLPAQLTTIRGMAKSLAKHELVMSGILHGEIEKSMFWRDPDTGIYLKSRPDVIPNDSGDFADLKTTTSVRYDALQNTIAEYGYHQQAALVGHIYKQLTGRPMTSFSLVCVETKIPYCVRVVTLRDEDLARGHEQNMIALKMLRRALDTNEWPGPGDYSHADFIDLPDWKRKRIDEDVQYLKLLLADRKKEAA